MKMRFLVTLDIDAKKLRGDTGPGYDADDLREHVRVDAEERLEQNLYYAESIMVTDPTPKKTKPRKERIAALVARINKGKGQAK